jgi:hypothetical protein
LDGAGAFDATGSDYFGRNFQTAQEFKDSVAPQSRKSLMKAMVFGLSLLALLVAVGCDGKHPDPKSALRVASARTFSSFDPPTPGEKLTPAWAIQFEQAELAQVLNAYAEISGRSIIRATNLPDTQITFSNQTPSARENGGAITR